MAAYPNLGGVFSKPVVSIRGRIPLAGQSDGSVTAQNSRVAYALPFAASGLILVYGNFHGSVSDSPGPNNITVRASFEDDEGAITVLSPGGGRDIVIEPGDYAQIPVTPGGVFPAGTIFYVRTRVVVGSGEKFGCNITACNSIDGATNGTDDSVDLTTGGTIAGAGDQRMTYAPICILGDTEGGLQPAVAIVGDSNSAGGAGGQFLFDVCGVPSNSEGYAGRAIGGTFPTANMGQNGETVSSGSLVPYRQEILAACSHALTMYGTNNIFLTGQSLDDCKAALVAFWTRIKANYGLTVFATTIPPQTTSSDGWQTEENQTPKAETSLRNDLNDWIRTTPAPLDGYFEGADTVETARNSGIWKVDQPTVPLTNVTNPYISSSIFNLTVGGTLPTDGSYDGWRVQILSGTGAGGGIDIAFISGQTIHGGSAFNTEPDGTSVYRIQKVTTGDGIHMNVYGQNRYASAVDPDAFAPPASFGNAPRKSITMQTISRNQTAEPLLFMMVLSSDGTTPATGLAPVVKISKNGAAGISPVGTVSEVDSTNMPGWYKVAGNANDSNTLGPILLHATAATALDSDAQFQVVAFDPRVALATPTNITAGTITTVSGMATATELAKVPKVGQTNTFTNTGTSATATVTIS